MPTILGHQAAGANWQALVTVLSVLTAVLFLLVVARVVKVASQSDLVLPLAGVVIMSSMGTAQSDTLSDHVGWALPLGVVAVAGLLIYAMDPPLLSPTSPLFFVFIVLAVLSGIVLQGPLKLALHPQLPTFDVQSLPYVDDLTITVLSPTPDSTVSSPFTLEIEVRGGTVANTMMTSEDAPSDPEELGMLRILDGTSILSVQPVEACSPTAPCTRLTYVLDLEPGTHRLYPEFLTATGSTFRTSVFASLVVHVQ